MIQTLLEMALWSGPLVLLWVYLVFPLLITAFALMQRVAPEPERSERQTLPGVTVIIPAFNEERHIEARIRNVLASDYPRDLLDVIVVSDASTDGTNEIAAGFASDGIRLLVQPERRGKTAGLNVAMAHARGDIVVFTDANAEYPPRAIPTLVQHFENPTVGLVSGYTRYTRTASGQVADATNAYTALELAIKRAESHWGCCVGADGAIFAMRRSLYRPLRHDDINDLVLPLSVIGQGYRCLLAQRAFCSEDPGESVESEFRRQSRITNRSLRAIWRHAHLLNPVRYPMFSLCLFSHKVLRFLSPLCVVVSGVALVPLAAASAVYLNLAAAALAGGLVLLLAARLPGLGTSASWFGRPVHLIHMFCSMNLAILAGWWKFLTGNSEVTWQHHRALGR
jgi:cellulose synthase/poly-beta-1,6-N-acetylglucosamine synthase-like glycosyltransferase